jgi:integrase/recombinase XerD
MDATTTEMSSFFRLFHDAVAMIHRATERYRGVVDHKGRIVTMERAKQTSAQAVVNMFAEWFAVLGFTGCSSHSGRRTFITNAARKISSVGGSLRDVQSLAGHPSLTTTQRYIEVNGDAKRRVVDM